jgi:hypothetical protein
MLDEYRREYTDFNAACLREQYLFHSGKKPGLEIAPIYDRYSDLFSLDSISRLKQSLKDTPEHFETERASLNRLLAFAVEQFLENSAKELTESISDYETAAAIESKGRKMTFHDAAAALTTEQNRESRHAIYKKRLALIDASNHLRAERLTRLHAAARALGHANYTSLFEELRQLDYEAIERESETLLARTESFYVARLDEALRHDLGIRVEEAERPDCTYLTHLTGYDDWFPASKLLEVYRETMAALGIRVDAQTNIEIDSLARPRKSCRAFCMPISVPNDIRLVIRPTGGQSDYQSLFHESGHAQHYAWASESLRPEFKHTGDYALTETYAFLFNHLISDSAWLTEFLGFRDNGKFIRSSLLARLITVRRHVAKLIYERELHAGEDLSRAAQVYAELQSDATKFKTGPTEFLFDLDDGFYSASYVRAWAFEVQLREHMKTRFGQRWWASRRAGNFLKEIWETGDRYTADEMAAQVGTGPITFDQLIDEFNQALKS